MLNSELDQLIYNVLLSRISPSTYLSDIIDESSIEDLIMTAKNIFDSEPMMLILDNPITIVGDLHGNVDDLIRIFERCGYPPEKKYLFLGDYVDRGQYSVEVMILLLALKCKYPNNINLLRGNHETSSMSKSYGFYHECSRKYNHILYESFTDMFKVLPIAALVADVVFCVHGGISPNLKSLKDFRKKPKPSEIFGDNIFTDLLWSDPNCDLESGYVKSPRGSGYYFSGKSLNEFLKRNDLQFIIRSHEECSDGYKWPFGETTCLTIFSNSNYCGHYNDAVVVGISQDLRLTHERFSPLTESEIQKRRIIWPPWLLENSEKFQIPLSPSSSDEMIQDLVDDQISFVM